MRILVLLKGDILREQRVCKQIETLRRAGHEIVLLTLPSEEYLAVRFEAVHETHAIRLTTRPLPKNLLFWPLKYLEMNWRFVREGLKLKPDVVHCVDRMTLQAGALIARKLGVPYVYDSEEIEAGVNSSANRPRWLWLWLERRLAQRAARVMVTDHFRRDITAELLQVPCSKIYVLMSLPHVPSPTKTGRDVRSDCGNTASKLMVYAGAIKTGRHLEDIVHAVARLPEDYALAVVGYGTDNYLAQLRSLVEECRLQHRVFFLPPVKWSDVTEYIASADCSFAFYEKNSLNNLYCSPSKLFDAMMAGVPVVASDNPLVLEVVQENDAGICVPSVTPATIAEAVASLCSRPDLPELKRRTSQLSRQKYCWESQEEEFICFYESICPAGTIHCS